ncbi:MAG: hypothetical protein A3H29_16850 [Acidobacteria bacterium RIFCSPLOWO2_02_FULL_67_21]|nr:MAG: hypothetical protein A3H29_16850 [Acidobacteria bacterium RIFCSPLOWO2_02_FULL_67_21]
MIEIRRILCPVDFSECSRHAFDYAAAIARWYGSAITMLYVQPLVPLAAVAPGAPAFPAYVMTAAERSALIAGMRRLAEGEAGANPVVDYQVAEGSVGVEILALAEKLSCDLMVMGTHGRSGFDRLLLGSVTERILRKAACPVLVVPPRAPDAVPLAPVFRRILCAVDFSDCSLKALDFAISLAEEADARLTVLHVVEFMPEEEEVLTGTPDTVRKFVAETEAERRRRLDALVPGAVRSYCTVETEMARGKPGRAILRVAAERAADLIVLGVHGRGAADLAVFGSTTQHVVRAAACPVLTLRD